MRAKTLFTLRAPLSALILFGCFEPSQLFAEEAIAARSASAKPSTPTVLPTYGNVAYGPETSQTLDFWQAKSKNPAPLIVNIHGGGWRHGPIEPFGKTDQRYLDMGISVAHITYRFTPKYPLPMPVHDAARAVQFLRSKAMEWNIDPARVILTGFSAGGCSALWLATHNDLANPHSADPVLRQSTRVSGVIVAGAQTTIEPALVQAWVGDGVKHPMFCNAGGYKNNEEMLDAIADMPQVAELYKEFSPINHLTPDDPPMLLLYTEAREGIGGVHGGWFGVKFKQKADALGMNHVYLEVAKDKLQYPGYPGGGLEFVKKNFELSDVINMNGEADRNMGR